jgi:hypothetical protein
MKLFSCDVCAEQIYFESTECVQCKSQLGYLPEARDVRALTAKEGATPTLRVEQAGAAAKLYQRCKNAIEYDACNWLVAQGSASPYCDSCSLSELVPNLTEPENLAAFKRLEAAKRRLLYTLHTFGLPVRSKLADPEKGLTFRFLEGTPSKPVMTGHDAGVVTLNIAEADPAFREEQRERLGEKYRTTLGHLRHEVGHYYFDRLVDDRGNNAQFRALFGDERADYQEALARHYESGPPADWQHNFISAYATMHPWEDWAETFAHYLHMVDTLETAQSYGLAVKKPDPESAKQVVKVRAIRLDDFAALMQGFHAVSLALNGLNRSMGLPDAYPFAVPPAARTKLEFVHRLVNEVR